MRLIKLVLNAPLQSWGEDSRWDNRETSASPTKSGIIGLLGCCLGYPRGDSRLNALNDELHIAVRSDKSGSVMTDFNTVQGTGGQLLNAQNKNRPGDTIITPKQYLQDARFTVFIWGSGEMLSECYEALKHPKWLTYLGRKCCVPSMPLLPEYVDAATPDEAVRNMTQEEIRTAQKYIPVEIDMVRGDILRNDERLVERLDIPVRADRNEYIIRRLRVSSFCAGGV